MPKWLFTGGGGTMLRGGGGTMLRGGGGTMLLSNFCASPWHIRWNKASAPTCLLCAYLWLDSIPFQILLNKTYQDNYLGN